MYKKKKVIAIANQKGGVGKTTTAINLAASFAKLNYKTLIIDLDPQANSTTGLNALSERGVYSIFSKDYKDIHLLPQKTKIEGLDIIASDMNLSGVDLELANAQSREYVLKAAIEELEHYEYILIDCPPSLSLLTVNALAAAHNLLIPMQCEFYSLEGLSNLLKTVKLINKNFNGKLSILGILLTMFDKRNRLTMQVEKDVRSHLDKVVFDTVIPRNVRVSEAPSHGIPVILYDPQSLGAIAYIKLAKEILKKGNIKCQ